MIKMSLKAARVNAGFTQCELADKLGVSRQTVSFWERGERKPTKRSIIAFCAVVGVSERDIFLPKELHE